MDDVILLLLIISFFMFMLGVDSVFLGTLKTRDPKEWECFRWPVVISYIILGVFFVAVGGLPAEDILPPALIASAFSYYMNFIRNQDGRPRAGDFRKG